MNATQKNQRKSTTTKRGGSTLTKQVSDLAVPFGLILAKQSLQNFLNTESPTASSKKSAKSAKRVSLSGGKGCAKVGASAKVEGYDNSPRYSTVSKGGRKPVAKGGSAKSTKKVISNKA